MRTGIIGHGLTPMNTDHKTGKMIRVNQWRSVASVLFFAGWLAAVSGAAQAKFIPDPIVRYKIDARLDAQKKAIAGHETIVWKNHTSGAVPDLQFHLYLNAFKNNQSTFMKEGGSRRGMPRKIRQEDWGYEQIHSIKVDGQDLTSKLEYIHPDDDNADDQTVARVLLPKPIGAGQSASIEIEWTSKMPRIFARTGYQQNYFLVAQWFPKPGVYEGVGDRHRQVAGWNCHQFHSFTEFFADYGVFDVRLTVPGNFEIGATGAERSQTRNPDGTTTYNYYQEDVHDFAWVTEPKSQAEKITRTFVADQQVTPAEIAEWSQKTGAPPDEVKLQDVKVSLFMQREHLDQVNRHFRAIFAGAQVVRAVLRQVSIRHAHGGGSHRPFGRHGVPDVHYRRHAVLAGRARAQPGRGDRARVRTPVLVRDGGQQRIRGSLAGRGIEFLLHHQGAGAGVSAGRNVQPPGRHSLSGGGLDGDAGAEVSLVRSAVDRAGAVFRARAHDPDVRALAPRATGSAPRPTPWSATPGSTWTRKATACRRTPSRRSRC